MEIAKQFIQLGVAGAALFLMYHFGDKFFDFLQEKKKSAEKASDSKFDRLCEKIDKLVEAFYSNTQKNEVTATQLGLHYDILLEIKDKVNVIDVRTAQCLPDGKKVQL